MFDRLVVGLLEPANPKSLGMLGIVVEDEQGGLHSSGVRGPSAGPVDRGDWAVLADAGQAARVSGPVLGQLDSEQVALWIGDEFAQTAGDLGFSLPPIHSRKRGRTADGTYWVASSRHVYTIIDAWVRHAFRRVLRTQDAAVADLMRWAMPERVETRAARFYTRDPERRESDLRWWARLDSDHGSGRRTPDAMAEELGDLIRTSTASLGRHGRQVIGFSAAAKGGDSEVAQEFAAGLQLKHVGFGRWLKHRHAGDLGGQPLRIGLQRIGKEWLERDGGLTMCLDVLHDSAIQLTEEFVIDGIRHVEVLRSLEYLLGEDRFSLVYVDKPVEVRRRLLVETELLSTDTVEQVLNDSTERQIPEVRTRAMQDFDGMETQVVRQASSWFGADRQGVKAP